MIIYRDLTTDNKDEVLSDAYKIIDVGDGLWEVDCKMVQVGGENFQLEGANASAEGEDADDGGETATERVLDIVRDFRLNSIEAKPSKKMYMSEIKKYMKKVNEALKAKGESDDKIKEFQTGAQAAVKKILANYDNYDMYVGESMEEGQMYILVDFREDGVTPYATVWKHGLEEYKV
ncbi:hypothetical protein PMZ80_009221 [Knufia obscura]|uniref:Translationally-controlled tumor protein homolog n=2 Tax=Knufia TaxID=430999 RepID=A0AAN8I3W3_9EURO|nr:hypothetical protein PMZ80_009221 [Knufia obscura]KAK5949040.1 hypothetical protein OHC33_009961 [Knufia fluminis]